MNSEFDASGASADEQAADYTKYMWLGIVLIVAVMVAALWQWGEVRPNVSVAHARHILISFDSKDPSGRAQAYELIGKLRERILNGEDFGKIAREYSNDPQSRPKGGDLGYSPKGSYQTTFDEYVWSGKINEVSDIIQTSFGFHIIQVLERKVTSLDEKLDDEQRRMEQKLREKESTLPTGSPEQPSTQK